MIKCPVDGTEITKIIKEWDYSFYHVKSYYCEKCQHKVMAYYKEGELVFTIPKDTRTYMRRKILKYFKKYGGAEAEELVNALHLSLEDVLIITKELEQRKI